MKISLIEMFGTKADIKWKPSSTGEIGSFALGDQEFEIVYNEYDPIKLEGGASSGELVEVGFSRIKDDKPTIELTNNHDAIKVFSVILNGLHDKFMKGGYPTTLFFSAKRGDDYDRRASFYTKLQYRISKFGYDVVRPITNAHGTHFILTKTDLSGEDFAKLKKLVVAL